MTSGFLRNGRVRAGGVVLAIFVLVGALRDLLLKWYGVDPFSVDYDNLHASPGTNGHWLGTTISGQDVFAQLIAGARGSITVGLLSGVLATVLAVLIGVTSGFLGGPVDHALNSATNVVLTLPSFAMTLIVAGYLGSAGGAEEPAIGLVVMAILIGIFEWPSGARYLRSQTMSLRSRDFTMATKMTGESTARLIVVEVLPHLTGIISAMFLRAVVAGIFAEASLNFLGVATQGTISWGTMIANAQTQGALTYGWWWWFLAPGLCIALIGTATALINFGLDEVTNPRLRTANRAVVRAHARKARELQAAGDAA
ncbi:ABC transporter permease [Kribbella solani]|uniref:Peptide/nickel transport system permease protein n=1 Tax=Kribbella solani TaxID=236067 RepID=A0A841DRD2_9ACTN|nr:ABC transporter permease [Kribbella solani]MBB5977948.1 peptide/nickel transport system permease protein [Kribbella solani]